MQTVTGYRFKPRKERVVYDKTLWDSLKPGDALKASTRHEASAIETFSRARGWKVRRESQPDGTIVVGRIQ